MLMTKAAGFLEAASGHACLTPCFSPTPAIPVIASCYCEGHAKAIHGFEASEEPPFRGIRSSLGVEVACWCSRHSVKAHGSKLSRERPRPPQLIGGTGPHPRDRRRRENSDPKLVRALHDGEESVVQERAGALPAVARSHRHQGRWRGVHPRAGLGGQHDGAQGCTQPR